MELALRTIDLYSGGCQGLRELALATAILGIFVKNNSMCGMELDYTANEFSFEWKPFLTTFFTDYLYVGKRQDPRNPYGTVLKRTVLGLLDLPIERNTDNRRMLNNEPGFFEKAYIAWSRMAHEKMGMKVCAE